MDVYYFYNGITNIISFASTPTIINENNLISLIDDRFNRKVNKTINGGFLSKKKGKKKKNDETENDEKDSEDENNGKDNEGKDGEEENDEKDNEGKDGDGANAVVGDGKSKFSKFKDGLSGLKDGLSGAVSTIRSEDEEDEDSMSTSEKIKYLLTLFMKIIVFIMFMFLLPIAPFVALSYFSYIRLKKYYSENMYTL
tara:strand:+ start:362 stop:952 length:591 start_codon:yes stop_codon:yes gene_type:complete